MVLAGCARHCFGVGGHQVAHCGHQFRRMLDMSLIQSGSNIVAYHFLDILQSVRLGKKVPAQNGGRCFRNVFVFGNGKHFQGYHAKRITLEDGERFALDQGLGSARPGREF
jgi:hypothetical protein